jgi:hypothetical protein
MIRTLAPPAIVVLVVTALSLLQPTLAIGRDIRFEALASLVDARRTYMGDPGPSLVAANRLRLDHRAPIYDADLRVGSAYIYPPLACALYAPVATLPEDGARQTLADVNLLLLCIIVALSAALGPRRGVAGIVLAALTAILFYPLVHAIQLNQATVLVTTLAGGAMLALDRKRPALAGLLLGATFAIKPQLVLVLPFLVWRARPAVISAIATSLVLLLASLAYAGIDNHVDYVTRVLPTLSAGYAYYANQSWSALVQRSFFTGDISFFALTPAPYGVRALGWGLGALSYGAGMAMVWRWREREVAPALLLGLGWLVATMTSPIAWQHHYAPALFVFAMLLRAAEQDARLRVPAVTVPLAAAFALMASYFEVRGLHGAVSRLAVSYLLFGAALLATSLAVLLERGLLSARPEAASWTPPWAPAASPSP